MLSEKSQKGHRFALSPLALDPRSQRRIGNPDFPNIIERGDSLRDLQACAVYGCQPMLVLTGKGEKTKAEGDLPKGTLEFKDLSAAVDAILKETTP